MMSCRPFRYARVVNHRAGQTLQTVGLVAAHPVEGFGDHDLERAPSRAFKQPLDAGAEDHTVAGDRRVAVGADDLPSLASGVLAADAELVLDGSRLFWSDE